MSDYSPTQRRVLRELARAPNYMDSMGGNARGPILSACRALMRKGVLRDLGGSRYVLEYQFRKDADDELARWRREQKK